MSDIPAYTQFPKDISGFQVQIKSAVTLAMNVKNKNPFLA